MPYDYFFSYARVDIEDSKRYLDEFYLRLREEVRPLIGRHLEDVAFRDSSAIPVGSEWQHELSTELSTCRAFVYLSSPSYLRSFMCRKEWSLFRSRVRPSDADRRGCWGMIPIVWVPVPIEKMPAPLAAIQSSHESLGGDYTQLGMRGIMLRGTPKRRKEIIAQLAHWIAHAIDHARLDEASLASDLHDIPDLTAASPQSAGASSTFHTVKPVNVGPKTAQFVFVVGDIEELRALRGKLDAYGIDREADWKPYFAPIEREAHQIAMNAAYELKLEYNRLPLDDNLITRIREAEKNNCVVILVVDSWSLHLEKLAALMAQFDLLNFKNCEIIVPFNAEDEESRAHEEQLRAKIFEIFDHQDESKMQHGITCHQQFHKALCEALQRRRDRIRANPNYVRKLEGIGPMALPQL